MATTTRSTSGFHERIYREVTDFSMRSQPEEYSSVLRVLTSDRNFERFKAYKSGVGLPRSKPELDPIQFGDPTEGGVREYSHETKAIGFKASDEAEEDDKYDVVSAAASSLGDSLREGYEIDFANVWNNCLAGDSTPILTFDGLSIANDAHTRLDFGATQDNLTTGDISLALLEFARYHFRNLRNDDGFRDQSHARGPFKVIIAPDATTEPLLDQMMGINGMQPFTADNTPHELGETRGQFQKVVYSYLTDTDRTIVLSAQALRKKGGPFAMWRRRPSMTSWRDDAIMGNCYAGSYRNSYGCPDWHGIVVSGG